MFCIKCGTQVEDDVLFCPKCGTKIERDDDDAPVTASVPTGPSTPTVSSIPTASNTYGNYNSGVNMMNQQVIKNKLAGVKPNKKTIAMIGAVLAVVVVAIILIVNHKTRVNLDKYLVVEYEGYDGIGKAVVSLDKKEFFDDNEKLKFNVSKLKKYSAISGMDDVIDILDRNSGISDYVASKGATALYECVNKSGSLDKSDGLSNGDEIVYTWDIEDQEIIEDILNCKLKYSDKKFEVKGLEKVETFNPFDFITVEYSGMSPNGRVEINGNDKSVNGLNFKADKYDGLSNGDTVTVTASYGYSEKDYIDSYGKLPYPLTQTYTVEGLASYITSSSEIPDDLIDKMNKQSVDVITSTVANNYNYSGSSSPSLGIDSLEYLGNYFLSSKNGYSSDSKVFMVYDLTLQAVMDVKDEGTVKEDYDCYVAVRFEAPMLDTDGTGAVDISNTYLIGSSRYIKTDYKEASGWGTYDFSIPGYGSLDELYNEIVTKNLANYNHEDNIE